VKKNLPILVITAVMAVSGPGVLAENDDNGLVAFDNGNYRAALIPLASAADNGSTDALYALGLMHEYGLGVDISPGQAAGYYLKGARIHTRENRLAQARVFITALDRIGR
jgi:TPR repeat protein